MKKHMAPAIPNRSLVQRLVVNHSDVMPIVKATCSKKRAGAPTHVDYQDIVGAAFLGIAKARQRFRKGKGTKFTTYTTTRVIGEVRDLIRREHTYAKRYLVLDEMPRSLEQSIPSSEVRLGNRDLFESVCEMLSELPPNQFDAVVGFYLDERPERDLAEEMSLSVVGLRRLISTALETVRSRFIASNPGRQRAWIED